MRKQLKKAMAVILSMAVTLGTVVTTVPENVKAAEVKVKTEKLLDGAVELNPKKENPYKKFVIGKKNFSSKYKKSPKAKGTITLSKKTMKVKINVQMKKGYKLENVYMTSYRKVKNNTKVKLKSYEKNKVYMSVEYTIVGDPTKKVYENPMELTIKRKK